MKILVTGANGYLGTGVVKRLLNDGIEVIAADFAINHIDKRAKAVECNLFEIEDPYNYFGLPEVLLHMAWRDGFVHNSPAHIEDLDKHKNFIEKMARSSCKTIAVMGSMHEVGFFEGAIKENTPTNPESLYGISKNALRDITKLICKENSKIFQWLRGFYIVGNSKFGSSIFSKITAAEEEGKEIFPFTTGKNQCDYIDYEDFCRQVAAAVEQTEINGIINICSGEPQSLSTRVTKFINDNNYKIKLDYGKFPDRPYDSKAVWGDPKKINEILEKKGQKA